MSAKDYSHSLWLATLPASVLQLAGHGRLAEFV